MKPNYQNLKHLLVLCMLIVVGSCSKGETTLSDGKALLSFVFNSADNAVLNEAVTGTISASEKTITVNVPYGTDISALTPTISVSELATINLTGVQDFSSPVIYTVTAEDGSTEQYTCNVIVGENTPPNAFNLLTPAADVTNVGRQLDFTWEATTDPNGEAITYTFYLDTNEEATQWRLAGLISPTALIRGELLQENQTYYWRVEAIDEGGAITSSAIRSFTTRSIDFSSTAVVTNAEFSKRDLHTSVFFNGKLWVIGGRSGSGIFENDVWSSSDGATWTEVTDNAAFSGRYGHTSVVYDDKLWVIGGFDGTRKKDVWSSPDGITWTEETADAGFSQRYLHTSVAHSDKIWVIGGHDGDFKNDVWYSEDGVNWTEANSNPPFTERSRHTTVVFNNKIWIIGGRSGNSTYENDVWSSYNGITWTEETADAGFPGRYLHSTVVYSNKLWVIGGDNGSYMSDIWSSSDGVTWTEVPSDDADFLERSHHTSVSHNDKLWVIGGIDNNDRKNDVWAFD